MAGYSRGCRLDLSRCTVRTNQSSHIASWRLPLGPGRTRQQLYWYIGDEVSTYPARRAAVWRFSPRICEADCPASSQPRKPVPQTSMQRASELTVSPPAARKRRTEDRHVRGLPSVQRRQSKQGCGPRRSPRVSTPTPLCRACLTCCHIPTWFPSSSSSLPCPHAASHASSSAPPHPSSMRRTAWIAQPETASADERATGESAHRASPGCQESAYESGSLWHPRPYESAWRQTVPLRTTSPRLGRPYPPSVDCDGSGPSLRTSRCAGRP